MESCSFLTKSAKRIKLKDCTNATTGPTNETEPTANAWKIKGRPRAPVKPASDPINTARRVSELRSNAITTQMRVNAIVVEPRNVLRQDDCWVDLPPRVLVKAFAKAFAKEAISPIIICLLAQQVLI